MKRLTLAALVFPIFHVAMADVAADEAALRALDQAYAAHWKAGDADGVMALFTDDATLVPHHGDAPVKGRADIRQAWFNPAFPPTVIREWRREPAEIFIDGDTGVLRGRARLVWEFAGERVTIPESNYVMIAQRGNDGWRIRLLTWNDDPRDWIEETID